MRSIAALACGLFISGCTDDFLHGKKCTEDGQCLEGFRCDPVSQRCLRPEEIFCSDQDGWQILLTDVSLSGGGSSLEVDPGESIDILVEYSVSQAVGCNRCTNEFLFGMKGAGYGHQPLLCHRIGIPPFCPDLLGGQASFDLQAPNIPGQYFLTSTVSREPNCQQAMNRFFDWMEQRMAQAADITVREPACSSGLFYLTSVSLAGGGPEASAQPSDTVPIQGRYTAARLDTCPDCAAQLVIGVDGSPQLCLELGQLPACPEPATGDVAGDLSAPADAGSYAVKVALLNAADCQGALNSYQASPPGSGWTVGTITVEAP